MPHYVIERELPGAGRLTSEELRAVARKSNEVLARLGPAIVWEKSYVTENRLYCLYQAPSPELVREHARQGGFPADRISEVRATISPATAEEGPQGAVAPRREEAPAER
jgi:hypothetical protein